ncbi:MAG: C40 family peptidase [Muribaculaceae bacterium]|nr:C40 family peptidase [Muribaculaceae bacterium]
MKHPGQEQRSNRTKSRGSTTERLTRPKPATGAQTSRLVKEARKWIGTPYRYGGVTRSGVDCSGLVMELYREVYGIKLPRSSAAQQEFCVGIPYKELAPGDLVFFATGRGSMVSHVGLYIGSDRMIHASSSRGVIESGLNEKYYQLTFHSAGRVIQPSAPSGKTVPPKTVTDKTEPKKAVTDKTSLIDSLERIIEQQIDSIYVADPTIFD